MKSRRTQIIATLATIILVVGFVLVPHEAHAWSFLPNTEEILDSVIAFLFNNLLLPLANMFVQLTGYLLNATMTITLNMNTLVSSSGGIVDSTWSIIRDISSILIIFFLLYTAIEIIIGISDSKVRHLIIMVAVAGILINFSLFFTKIAVDTSNLVSLAFYRAITPTGSAQWNGNGAYLTSAINDGGLSNVFMNALSLQTFYNPATTAVGTQTNTNPIAVMAAGSGGVVVMVIAGLSFLAAAILFAVRIGLLILLMAFSPVFFLGMIIPKFKKEISDLWKNTLIGQCFIMPVYLLFMYVAMRVITNPTFKNVLNPSTVAANASGSTGVLLVSASTVGTVIQYIIAILLISIPLVAALKYASVGKDWANAIVKKGKQWGKSAVSGTASFAGRNTFGAAATKANESGFMKKMYESNPNAARLLSGTFTKVGSSYGEAREATEKKNKAVFENVGKVDRAKFKEGPEGDKAYNEAKNAANLAQANYLANMRKSSIWTRVSARVSGSSIEDNRRSSYGIAYGKEGKKLHENLEKQVKAKETERDEYLTTPNVPPPIPGAAGNKADQLEKDIRIIKQRMGNLAQYKPGEKEEEEMAEKIKRDLKEEMEGEGGGKKGGGSKKSEESGDSAKEKLSGDKP
jgi:hypothetical protein